MLETKYWDLLKLEFNKIFHLILRYDASDSPKELHPEQTAPVSHLAEIFHEKFSVFYEQPE